MTTFTLVRKNIFRNRLRTILTIVAVTFPLMIFTVIMAVQDGLTRMAHIRASELRLAVTHRVSIINGLPLAHARRILALDPAGDRIRAVSAMRWFGGSVPGEQYPTTSLAVDRETFAVCYPEFKLTPETERAWRETRNAAILGNLIANERGWQIGQRVVLQSTVPPYAELEFKVVHIGGGELEEKFLFALDYLEESYKQVGAPVGFANVFWVKCNRLDDLGPLSQQIDELFRYDPDQTKTQSEAAFFESFVQQEGNIPLLIKIIGSFVVFVVIMVSLNTMSLSFRERTSELAVFRALGFRPRFVLGMLLGESLFITLMAVLIGCLPLYLFTRVNPISVGPIRGMTVPTAALLDGIFIALLIGILAGIGPAIGALRIRVATALRSAV